MKKSPINKSLLALAVAAMLASGVAAADRFTLYVDDRNERPVVRVQHYDNDWRGWYDEGRRLSIDERQARINGRIEHGFANGALTRREARQLERQLANTEEKERAFESDGRLTGRERAELHRDLDGVAQRLRFERRDADRRY